MTLTVTAPSDDAAAARPTLPDVLYYHAARTCNFGVFLLDEAQARMTASLDVAAEGVKAHAAAGVTSVDVADDVASDAAHGEDEDVRGSGQRFTAGVHLPALLRLREEVGVMYADPNMLRRSLQPLWPLTAAPGSPAIGPRATPLHASCTAAQRRLLASLVISGKHAAGQAAALDALNVTHVLCCYASGAELRGAEDAARWPCLAIPAVDNDVYDIIQHFDEAIAFARGALEGDPHARLLVHCSAGMHRCAAYMAVILVVVGGFALDTALQLIKAARPWADPTPAFRVQLQRWAAAR
jgi:hypothetical protein